MPGEVTGPGANIFYRSRLWTCIWVYILLTYATLPVMRPALKWLRQTVGLETMGTLVNAALLVAAIALLLLALRKGLAAVGLALLPLLTIAAIASQLTVAEERVHFLQYGLLGVMVIATGRHHTWCQWLVMLGFVCAVGAIDELIQWGLPNRVGDWRDVGFNSAAGLLGAIMGVVLFWRGRVAQAPASNSTIS